MEKSQPDLEAYTPPDVWRYKLADRIGFSPEFIERRNHKRLAAAQMVRINWGGANQREEAECRLEAGTHYLAARELADAVSCLRKAADFYRDQFEQVPHAEAEEQYARAMVGLIQGYSLLDKPTEWKAAEAEVIEVLKRPIQDYRET